MPESADFRIEDSKGNPVPKTVLTSHQGDSGRGTQGHCMGIVETDTFGRESIKIRRIVRNSSITTQGFNAEVVS